MATLILMPRLSPTMEEGVLVKWTKQEGEQIAPGDIIAEVETDKATMDFPLEEEGVLLKHLARAGDTIKLAAPVAILGEAGEDISDLLAQATGGAGAAPPPAEPAPVQAAVEAEAAAPPDRTEVLSQAAPTQAQPQAQATPAQAAPAPAQAEAQPGRVIASPLARRLATDAGLDLRQLRGSGPGGRIVKRDIERALSEREATARVLPPPGAPAPAAASAPAAPAPAVQPVAGEVVPLSMMRKTIARRLTESKQTVPHFYLTGEAGVDALWRFREELNAAGEGKVSVNDLVLKAMARALRLIPEANMSYAEAGFIRHGQVDLSVAVALPEGLITPVVRGAESKSVGAISAEVRDLAERARQKRLRPEEYQGGTFSVSNLGMYGIREFFAIINPPESGILAVGKIEKRPVVVEREGQDVITVQRRMTLTLSCDHRVIDGALGARLLAEVVRGLEQPLLLVL
jgi:pyruvate dehydrogenase E2 component (dihydrolipoamide acetyltransferase)